MSRARAELRASAWAARALRVAKGSAKVLPVAPFPRPAERLRRRAFAGRIGIALVFLACACSRSPRLAGGPIELTQVPTVVRFEEPVPAAHPSWELCFEFDLPAHSLSAERIEAVLLTEGGERHALVETRLDRRGERDVCLLGRVAADTGAEPSEAEPVTYEAVELRAEVPLRLRTIRGGSVP